MGEACHGCALVMDLPPGVIRHEMDENGPLIPESGGEGRFSFTMGGVMGMRADTQPTPHGERKNAAYFTLLFLPRTRMSNPEFPQLRRKSSLLARGVGLVRVGDRLIGLFHVQVGEAGWVLGVPDRLVPIALPAALAVLATNVWVVHRLVLSDPGPLSKNKKKTKEPAELRDWLGMEGLLDAESGNVATDVLAATYYPTLSFWCGLAHDTRSSNPRRNAMYPLAGGTGQVAAQYEFEIFDDKSRRGGSHIGCMFSSWEVLGFALAERRENNPLAPLTTPMVKFSEARAAALWMKLVHHGVSGLPRHRLDQVGAMLTIWKRCPHHDLSVWHDDRTLIGLDDASIRDLARLFEAGAPRAPPIAMDAMDLDEPEPDLLADLLKPRDQPTVKLIETLTASRGPGAPPPFWLAPLQERVGPALQLAMAAARMAQLPAKRWATGTSHAAIVPVPRFRLKDKIPVDDEALLLRFVHYLGLVGAEGITTKEIAAFLGGSDGTLRFVQAPLHLLQGSVEKLRALHTGCKVEMVPFCQQLDTAPFSAEAWIQEHLRRGIVIFPSALYELALPPSNWPFYVSDQEFILRMSEATQQNLAALSNVLLTDAHAYTVEALNLVLEAVHKIRPPPTSVTIRGCTDMCPATPHATAALPGLRQISPWVGIVGAYDATSEARLAARPAILARIQVARKEAGPLKPGYWIASESYFFTRDDLVKFKEMSNGGTLVYLPRLPAMPSGMAVNVRAEQLDQHLKADELATLLYMIVHRQWTVVVHQETEPPEGITHRDLIRCYLDAASGPLSRRTVHWTL